MWSFWYATLQTDEATEPDRYTVDAARLWNGRDVVYVVERTTGLDQGHERLASD